VDEVTFRYGVLGGIALLVFLLWGIARQFGAVIDLLRERFDPDDDSTE
jgi:hypothetical protein